MVKNLDEILSAVKAIVGEDITDDVVRTLEDISDTLAEYANYKSRYDDLNKEWRARYVARFGVPVESDDGDGPSSNDNEPEEISETFTLSDVFEKEEE